MLKRGYGEKGTLLHCWWECKLIQPLWRAVWRFLKKIGIKLPYEPTIPLLGIYPEETIVEESTRTPVFTAALLAELGRGVIRMPIKMNGYRDYGTDTQWNITQL